MGPLRLRLTRERVGGVVPRRHHLRGPRQGLRRRQCRRDRRFSRLTLEARLSARPGRDRPVAASLLPIPAAGRRLRHRRLQVDQPVVRDDGRLPSLPSGGAQAGPQGHHRARHQPHLRSAPWFQRAARRRRAAPSVTSTSGPTTPSSTRTPASSSRTPRPRTGPGIRWPTPTTGIASSPTSQTSTSRTRRSTRQSSMPSTSGSATGSTGFVSTPSPISTSATGRCARTSPETHGFLKELRARVDAKYDDRMLLAEANQWPEEAAAYFGDGDECHMCFHFPLMPRLFMSLRMETGSRSSTSSNRRRRFPRTPPWAIFLRNHDELTLEMVTDEERDYMYRVYADDPQTRINVGIRRRLAPLLGNNRRGDGADERPAPVAARHTGPLLRRRDRHGRQRLPGRPERSAHPDAMVGRPECRVLRRQSPAALLPGDHRPRVSLRDHQRRGAAGQPELVVVVGEAPSPCARACPSCRVAVSSSFPTRTRKSSPSCDHWASDRSWSWPISPVTPNPSSST